MLEEMYKLRVLCSAKVYYGWPLVGTRATRNLCHRQDWHLHCRRLAPYKSMGQGGWVALWDDKKAWLQSWVLSRLGKKTLI